MSNSRKRTTSTSAPSRAASRAANWISLWFNEAERREAANARMRMPEAYCFRAYVPSIYLLQSRKGRNRRTGALVLLPYWTQNWMGPPPASADGARTQSSDQAATTPYDTLRLSLHCEPSLLQSALARRRAAQPSASRTRASAAVVRSARV